MRGIPVVVSLMDYWFLCARIILRRGDGTLCDGPPHGGLGCVPCVMPEVAAALRFDVESPLWRALAGDGTAPGESQRGPAARAHAIVRRLPRPAPSTTAEISAALGGVTKQRSGPRMRPRSASAA